MYRLLLTLTTLALLDMPGQVWAADAADADAPKSDAAASATTQAVSEDATVDEEIIQEEADLPPLHYVLEPEMDMWLGAAYFDSHRSRRASEFSWPYSSVVGGFKVNYAPLPHRLSEHLFAQACWLDFQNFLP